MRMKTRFIRCAAALFAFAVCWLAPDDANAQNISTSQTYDEKNGIVSSDNSFENTETQVLPDTYPPEERIEDTETFSLPDDQIQIVELADVRDHGADLSEKIKDEIRGKSSSPALPNPEYEIASVRIVGNMSHSREYILRMMDIEVHDHVTIDQLEEARFKLAVSGLFNAVKMKLSPGRARSSLDIEISVDERSQLQINNYYIGSDKKNDAWFGLDVSWLAPFDAKHRARMQFAATTANDYTLSLFYLIPTIANSPFSLNFSFHAAQTHERLFGFDPRRTATQEQRVYLDDMDFRRIGGLAGVGFAFHRDMLLFLRVAYDNLHRDNDLQHLSRDLDAYLDSGTSHLVTARISLLYDNRGGAELPNSGHFVHAALVGTCESAISNYEFIRLSLRHQSNIQIVSPQHIFRIGTFIGGVFGDAPFFEKFFFGDFYDLSPARIGVLNPAQRGAFDLFGLGAQALGYEDYLARISFSYAWQPIARQLEFFGLVSAIWANSKQSNTLRLGIESNASRSKFPLDMSFNVGMRIKTDYGLFSLTLAHIFNLIPR